MYHPFTIGGTIRKAWDVIKKNYIVLIVFTMVTFGCNVAITEITENMTSDNIAVFFAVRVLIMLLEAYLTLGFYKLLLTLIDKEYYEFSLKDILPSFKMCLNAVAIGIILILLLGLIQLINFRLVIPDIAIVVLLWAERLFAVYLSIRLIFCLCFIVDDNSGPFESLMQSFKITKGYFLKLFILVLIALVFVALILLIINAIVTAFVKEDSNTEFYLIEFGSLLWFAIVFPTIQVMIITTYRKLVYSHQDVDDDIAESL